MKYPKIKRDDIDFISDTETCNIGYNEGVLEADRPYRIEMWASFGITSATIFISTKDLEEKSDNELKEYLLDNEIIEIIEDKILVTRVYDTEANEFYSINVPIEGSNDEINKVLVQMKPYDFE